MTYYVKADRFLLENEERLGGFLQITNGRFGEFTEKVSVDANVLDYSGCTIAPGLFDTHIHGIKGYDIMDGKLESVQAISESILSLGVTRFLPTTLTAATDDLKQAIISIRNAVHEGLPGALAEGIFLEGPYFTDLHKGAQNPNFFRNPDIGEFKQWQRLAEGMIVKIAIAPERIGTFEFIRNVSEKGVLISIAHTDASYECCKEAVDYGVKNYVHLFNGMTGLHHRNPGVVGAALSDDRVFAELICDGHHVHPDIAMLAYRIKNEKLMLITDCMRAGSMSDGNYILGEYPVVMKNGIVRLNTGSLAGSTLKLIDGVKNLSKWSDSPLHKVWHLASLTPAMSLGKERELGSIEFGKIADYVVFDSSFEIRATAVAGEIKWDEGSKL
jgi:N-acetylglucosamine-6-phosphate deacetylase